MPLWTLVELLTATKVDKSGTFQFSELTVRTSWDLLKNEYQSILSSISQVYQTLGIQESKMVSLTRDHAWTKLLHESLQTRIATNLKNNRRLQLRYAFKNAKNDCRNVLRDIKSMAKPLPNCN